VAPNDLTKKPSSLALYTRAAERSSAEIIATYSTSFGWATNLLSKDVAVEVRNIYAMVRVADELVDGAADEALDGKGGQSARGLLDEFEAETYRALDSGFSSNLVLHAFAVTARKVGITRDLVTPFFDSMRMDLDPQVFDQHNFEKYIYGSAEVVGLMCLQAFLQEVKLTEKEKADFVKSARALGSAFQKVNFLRDLAADFKVLGRSYFPGVRIDSFNEAEKQRLVADINDELKISAQSLPNLPKNSRRAVAAAQMFFTELNNQIGKAPADRLISERIRVSNPRKVGILIRAWFGVLPK
jgi:phytoene/squalene synthetase